MQATDQITKGDFEGKQKIISSLTDSLALLGHATYDLSLRRRDIMRPSINEGLRALCSQQIPVTEFLFGDDVHGSLKTVKNATILPAQLSPKGQITNTNRAIQEPDIIGLKAMEANLFRPTQGLPAIQKEVVDPTAQTRGDQVSLITTLQTVIDDVSKFKILLPSIITGLEQSVKTFKAGNLARFLNKWKSISADKEFIDMITCTTIEFEYIPVQTRPPVLQQFSDTEIQITESEITKLLNKGVIVQAVQEDGDFLSPIFIRQKKDGSYHLILNLKALNKTITYHQMF